MKFIKTNLEKFFDLLGNGFWENYWVLNFFANIITLALFLISYFGFGDTSGDFLGLFIGNMLFLTLATCFLLPNVFLLLCFLIVTVRKALVYGDFRRHYFVPIFWLGLANSVLEFFVTIFTQDIQMKDWQEQLTGVRSLPKHSFIWLESVPTIGLILGLSLLAFLVYALNSADDLPPLVHVFCILGIYSGLGLIVIYHLQLNMMSFQIIFWFFLAWSLMIFRMKEWTTWQKSRKRHGLLVRELSLIEKPRNWLWLSVVFALPIYSLLLIILQIFGQEPDAIIKAWTETADWTFSEKIAPKSIVIEDEHYLCTVAARGHKKLVKPVRMGIRHGHWVKVNRQLCIANAFEQILEEKMPRFHHAVRFVYDRYGYPFAKKIKNPFVMDSIYLLMKPLEWLFLLVLYTVDTHPENRISMQYISPIPEGFTEKS